MTTKLSRVSTLLTVAFTSAAVTAAPATAAENDQVVTRVSAADRGRGAGPLDAGADAAVGGRRFPAPAERIGRTWEGPVPPGVGRLFFTAVPGVDESCTATVVPSAGKDVALTAGHCVNGGPDRLDNPIKIVNVVFVPGYDHGTARAFAWSATYSGPTSGTDDDAVLALDPVAGHHVADVAGTQDISFDRAPSPVDTTILGYPVSRPAGGETLVSCARPATGEGTIFGATSRGTMNEDGVTLDLTSAAFTGPVRELYERAGDL